MDDGAAVELELEDGDELTVDPGPNFIFIRAYQHLNRTAATLALRVDEAILVRDALTKWIDRRAQA